MSVESTRTQTKSHETHDSAHTLIRLIVLSLIVCVKHM